MYWSTRNQGLTAISPPDEVGTIADQSYFLMGILPNKSKASVMVSNKCLQLGQTDNIKFLGLDVPLHLG